MEFTYFLLFVLGLWIALSWLEMRSRLNRVERKLNMLLCHHGVDVAKGLSDRVKQLADDPAKKIEAIKVYREETGAGLAEAKAAVEQYIHSK